MSEPADNSDDVVMEPEGPAVDTINPQESGDRKNMSFVCSAVGCGRDMGNQIHLKRSLHEALTKDQ